MPTRPSSADGRNIALDLRHLPAPEPMVRALEAVDALLPGDALSLRTPIVPVPLLQILAERGLHVDVQTLPDGSAAVEILQPARGERDGPARA